MDALGERVKEIRKEKKLTQTQFAQDMAISQTHVSKIEKGVERPSSTLLRLISLKYNVDEEWLTHGTGYMRKSWSTMKTDEEVTTKYETVREWFDKMIQNRTGDDLLYTVEAYNYLNAVLSPQYLSESDTSKFIRHVHDALDEYERAMFALSFLPGRTLVPSKNDVKGWQQFRSECEEKYSRITESIKASLNVYLSLRGDEMKI